MTCCWTLLGGGLTGDAIPGVTAPDEACSCPELSVGPWQVWLWLGRSTGEGRASADEAFPSCMHLPKRAPGAAGDAISRRPCNCCGGLARIGQQVLVCKLGGTLGLAKV